MILKLPKKARLNCLNFENSRGSNCLVTNRWTLQITDFGLHELRSNAEDEDSDDENPSVC